MGCVNPDGTLSVHAQEILNILDVTSELDEVARKTGLPLYRVRAAARELAEAHLVEEVDGGHRATEAGLKLVRSPQSEAAPD